MNLQFYKLSCILIVQIISKSIKIKNKFGNDLYEKANIRIRKICQFLEPNFGFPKLKNSRNLLIFKFEEFQKFPLWKISKIFKL